MAFPKKKYAMLFRANERPNYVKFAALKYCGSFIQIDGQISISWA
jgi:hypothetical protein